MTRMELNYGIYGSSIKAENITMGSHYVTKYESIWYRVRAIEEENSEVLCFFIDDGDELSVLKEDLYQLKREFASTQAQVHYQINENIFVCQYFLVFRLLFADWLV